MKWFFLVTIVACPLFVVLAAICWHTGRPEWFSYSASMATLTFLASLGMWLFSEPPSEHECTCDQWDGPRPGKG